MNLFQLVLKQMRQRALGTWLTLLSVMLGVALAVAVLLLREAGESLLRADGLRLRPDRRQGLAAAARAQHRLPHRPEPGEHPVLGLRRSAANRATAAAGEARGADRGRRHLQGPADRRHAAEDVRLRRRRQTHRRRTEDARSSTGRASGSSSRRAAVFHPRKFEAVIGSDVTRAHGAEARRQVQGDARRADRGPGGPTCTRSSGTSSACSKPTHTANDRVIFIPLVTLLRDRGARRRRWEQAIAIRACRSGTSRPHGRRSGQGRRPRHAAANQATHDDHDHEHDDEHEQMREHKGDEHEDHDHHDRTDTTSTRPRARPRRVRLPRRRHDRAQAAEGPVGVSAILVKSDAAPPHDQPAGVRRQHRRRRRRPSSRRR